MSSPEATGSSRTATGGYVGRVRGCGLLVFAALLACWGSACGGGDGADGRSGDPAWTKAEERPRARVRLRVTKPPREVATPTTVVRGRVTPGARVEVDGEPAQEVAGRFRVRVRLRQGRNKLTGCCQQAGFSFSPGTDQDRENRRRGGAGSATAYRRVSTPRGDGVPTGAAAGWQTPLTAVCSGARPRVSSARIAGVPARAWPEQLSEPRGVGGAAERGVLLRRPEQPGVLRSPASARRARIGATTTRAALLVPGTVVRATAFRPKQQRGPDSVHAMSTVGELLTKH